MLHFRRAKAYSRWITLALEDSAWSFKCWWSCLVNQAVSSGVPLWFFWVCRLVRGKTPNRIPHLFIRFQDASGFSTLTQYYSIITQQVCPNFQIISLTMQMSNDFLSTQRQAGADLARMSACTRNAWPRLAVDRRRNSTWRLSDRSCTIARLALRPLLPLEGGIIWAPPLPGQALPLEGPVIILKVHSNHFDMAAL